jgi:ParB family chromosome partitioning protein
VARRVGKDRSTVANLLRLLRLPKEIREMVADGTLDGGHGRALLAVDDGPAQLELAREAARRGLSVREVERRVAALRAPKPVPARPEPNTRAAEERLRAALGTRVSIRRRGKGGVLAIAFSGESELNRIFDLLVRNARARA